MSSSYHFLTLKIPLLKLRSSGVVCYEKNTRFFYVRKLTESQYYNDVKNASGNTLSEKAYNFLHEIGVPKEQLNAIISNFTE